MGHEAEGYPRYLMAASRQGDRLWKNVVGTFRTMDGERCVKCGLAPYSGDLIGLVRKKITLEDLGETYAVFVSVEVKERHKNTSKKRAEGQLAWRKAINKLGGVAIQVYTVEEMVQEIERWKCGDRT